MLLFSAKTLQYHFFLSLESWKNTCQKQLKHTQIDFFPFAWGVQTAQTEEFMFQNVAYTNCIPMCKTGIVLCSTRPREIRYMSYI